MNKKFLLLALLLATSFYPVGVSAEGNSITVSPALVDIEFSPDDTEKVTTFTLDNSYNAPVDITVELQGIDQQSGKIIPTADVDIGLLGAVRFSETLVTIPERSSRTVVASFQNLDSLSPGGHYGTIAFTQQRVADKDVSITQSVSVGLFLVKQGGQIRDVSVTTYRLKNIPFQLPSATLTEIKNVGNVHVVPRASVLVYDHSQNLVAKSIINEDSRRILPGSSLQSETKFVQTRRVWLPQKLTIVLEYRADGIEQIKQLTITKYYIPPYIFFVTPLILIGSGLLAKKYLLRSKLKKLRQETGSESDETIIKVRRGKSTKSPKSSPKKIVVKTIDTSLEP